MLESSICLSSLNLYKWKDNEGQEQEFRLVEEVSAKWNDFGLLLGFGLNQLDAWEAQYHGNANRCWNKVMDHWLSKGGSQCYPATWGGLFILLEDLGLTKASQVMQKAVR